MASCAVDAFVEGRSRDCGRLAVIAATLGGCSSLGVARVRAALAAEASSAKQQPADRAFLAHLEQCGGKHVRKALWMYAGKSCKCLGPALPGADLAKAVSAQGSLFIMFKEGAAIKFSANDLAGALHGYRQASTIMENMWSRRDHVSATRGAARRSLCCLMEASAAFAVAADLAPTPSAAAEFRREEAAQLHLASRADVWKSFQRTMRETVFKGILHDPPAVPGLRTAADGAAGVGLANIERVLGALEETTHDAALALAEYMRPSDMARLERACRFFGVGPLRRRVRARRAVRCQPVRNVCQSAAAAAALAAAATAAAAAPDATAAAAAASAQAAVHAYCAAAADPEAHAALEALAAALAALVGSHGTVTAAAAADGAVAQALKSVVSADTPTAERCAFWRACAAEAALQQPLLTGGDVCAAKYLLSEPAVALEVRAECVRAISEHAADIQAEFEAACKAGTLGRHPPTHAESYTQQLLRYDVLGEVAAVLRWARDPRAVAAAVAAEGHDAGADTAAAARYFVGFAATALYPVMTMYGSDKVMAAAPGPAISRHIDDVIPALETLPPRLPAERAISTLTAQQRAAAAAQLPPDATAAAVRAQCAYGAGAAEPVGAWLARNRWGSLVALAAFAALVDAEGADGFIARKWSLLVYLALRGEGWGGGAAAHAAFEGAVSSVDGLAEFFAGYYALVRRYAYALPQLNAAWAAKIPQQQH
ncbi:hypothetical protein JKP88DRAFT_284181 [Tribonema minus]|uniref:Uncharacterized protein n=1 Tax=Tribonema minus TaxID=303371 RepID=A0A835ZGW6_9STRA|nr:hypothetical protein JKP88DRAFT_284181 [Tribonema minus]